MPHTRNLLTKVAKRVLRGRHLKMRSVFAPPDTKEVWAQYGRIVEQLEKRFKEATKMLAETAEHLLACTFSQSTT